MLIGKIETVVSGRLLKIARLRHEWYEYLQDPESYIAGLKRARVADILTFLQEAHVGRPKFPFQSEPAGASLLTFKDYETWWNGLHFKARNKARKAQKSGVQLRLVQVDDDFVRGVEKIYNESPIRQGRAFWHYGKDCATIKNDLSSFPECTYFIGAYHEDRLIGFMKLFEGERILRIVHIIATFADRDKCVMDALVAKAVEFAAQKNITHLHYGDWAYRGLGTFRTKFGFERHDCPRYFAPLNARGALALKLGLHRPFRDRVPQNWKDRAAKVRGKWNQWRHGGKPGKMEVAEV